MARKGKSGNRKHEAANELPSDDEVEAFHKARDHIGLEVSSPEPSDSEDEEAVLDVSDRDEEDFEEEDPDSDEEIERGGKLGRCERSSPPAFALATLHGLLSWSGFVAHCSSSEPVMHNTIFSGRPA